MAMIEKMYGWCDIKLIINSLLIAVYFSEFFLSISLLITLSIFPFTSFPASSGVKTWIETIKITEQAKPVINVTTLFFSDK